MKLIIQKTTQPSGLISDAEISDIKELLSGLDIGADENSEAGNELEFDEEEFQMEEETDFTEMTVSENEEAYSIELTIPGFNKEDFIIEVSDDGILTINALSEVEFYENDETVLSRGVAEKTFNRALRLPEDANCSEIQARYEHGILVVSIRKI